MFINLVKKRFYSMIQNECVFTLITHFTTLIPMARSFFTKKNMVTKNEFPVIMNKNSDCFMSAFVTKDSIKITI